jgi:hypothetical protein
MEFEPEILAKAPPPPPIFIRETYIDMAYMQDADHMFPFIAALVILYNFSED